MAKNKTKLGSTNGHLHARIAYLQQAATYLALQQRQTITSKGEIPITDQLHDAAAGHDGVVEPGTKSDTKQSNSSNGLPGYLTSHLTQVARKSQIRLQPTVKHGICKRCSNALIEGKTSKKFTENLSKGGSKSHADVTVIECGTCGTQKRFPVGQQRQKKKSERKASKGDSANG